MKHGKSKTNLIQTAHSRAQEKVEPVSRAPPHKRVCGSSAGAAARLEGKRVGGSVDRCESQQPGLGWRFNNRYAHRSNGGIPMFAEERLKERAEKVTFLDQLLCVD